MTSVSTFKSTGFETPLIVPTELINKSEIIRPYIPTASQKIIDTRFLAVILGALIELPIIDEPQSEMPLNKILWYHAAPSIDRPRDMNIPMYAQNAGEVPEMMSPQAEYSL